jgi:hypothetical protein
MDDHLPDNNPKTGSPRALDDEESCALNIALRMYPHFFEEVINNPLLIVFGPPVPFFPGNSVVNG